MLNSLQIKLMGLRCFLIQTQASCYQAHFRQFLRRIALELLTCKSLILLTVRNLTSNPNLFTANSCLLLVPTSTLHNFPWSWFFRHTSKVTHPFPGFTFLSQRNLPQNMHCLLPDKPAIPSAPVPAQRGCTYLHFKGYPGPAAMAPGATCPQAGWEEQQQSDASLQALGSTGQVFLTRDARALQPQRGTAPGLPSAGPCRHSVLSEHPTHTKHPAVAAGHRASLHPAGLTPGTKLNHSHLTGSLSPSLPDLQPVNPAWAKLEPCSVKPDIPDSVIPIYLQLRLCTHK